MFSKLLFTLVLVAMIYIWVRARWWPRRIYPAREAHTALPPGARSPTGSPFKHLAYGLLALLLGGGGLLLWLDWRESQREVRVRVINTSTGDTLVYQSRLGEIRDRGFRTLDGRRVWLAPVERLEVDARPP